MVVEQKPEIVMAALKRFPNTFDWYKNGWLNLAILHPETDETYIFKGNDFVVYEPINKALEKVNDLESIFEANIDNLPAYNMY
jgi:hypothetical protein